MRSPTLLDMTSSPGCRRDKSAAPARKPPRFSSGSTSWQSGGEGAYPDSSASWVTRRALPEPEKLQILQLPPPPIPNCHFPKIKARTAQSVRLSTVTSRNATSVTRASITFMLARVTDVASHRTRDEAAAGMAMTREACEMICKYFEDSPPTCYGSALSRTMLRAFAKVLHFPPRVQS